jgi:hypothetical protein
MRIAFDGALMRGMIYGAAAALWAIACTSSDGGGGDDDSTKCERGTESCDCLDGACLAGLTCLSETCVREMGGTGGTQGGSAGASTGGNPQGGSGANPTGGTSGDGGSATGGSSGTAGTIGGSGMSGGGAGMPGGRGGAGGGTAGAGGSAGMCIADTETDPDNCGECGHVCRNQASEFRGRGCDDPAGECCADGTCGPYYSDCITGEMGFTNCTEVCASLGEECVQEGCTMTTWGEWSANQTDCETFDPLAGFGAGPCDTPIDFLQGAGVEVRCCCSDTQP